MDYHRSPFYEEGLLLQLLNCQEKRQLEKIQLAIADNGFAMCLVKVFKRNTGMLQGPIAFCELRD